MTSSSLTKNPWIRLDLDPDSLDIHIQKLRSWISKTILKPIVRESDRLNSVFGAQARQDLKIGEANLASLRHLLLSRPAEFEGRGRL